MKLFRLSDNADTRTGRSGMNKSRVLLTAFLAVFAFTIIAVVATDSDNANAATQRIIGRDVKWRAGVNNGTWTSTSTDSGYVLDHITDRTALLPFNVSEGSGGPLWLPDSIAVSFKAKDTGTGVYNTTDSASFTVQIETCADGDTVWSTVSQTIATILEVHNTSKITLLGFKWGPKFWTDTGTPLSGRYRYVFDGPGASADAGTTASDSTVIYGMREVLYKITN